MHFKIVGEISHAETFAIGYPFGRSRGFESFMGAGVGANGRASLAFVSMMECAPCRGSLV
jgi:hypothetical protein